VTDLNAQFGVVHEFEPQLSASVDGRMGIFMREMFNLSIFDYILDSIDK
jgi:hypothetical protein